MFRLQMRPWEPVTKPRDSVLGQGGEEALGLRSAFPAPSQASLTGARTACPMRAALSESLVKRREGNRVVGIHLLPIGEEACLAKRGGGWEEIPVPPQLPKALPSQRAAVEKGGKSAG